jgi:DNA-directed RNA polymerase subunit L
LSLFTDLLLAHKGGEVICRKEDDTLGNLLVKTLNQHPQVVWATYVIPQPLVKSIEVSLFTGPQTCSDAKHREFHTRIVNEALTTITNEIRQWQQIWHEAIAKHNRPSTTTGSGVASS